MLEGMELSVGEGERLAGVLVVMGEGAVSLGDVETKDGECDGTGELLLERTLLHVRDLHRSWRGTRLI